MKESKKRSAKDNRDDDKEIREALQNALSKVDPKIIQSIELVQRFSTKPKTLYKLKTSNLGTEFEYAQST